MTIEEAHAEVKYGGSKPIKPEALAQAVDALSDPASLVIASTCSSRDSASADIFPMMGKMAWLKLSLKTATPFLKLVRGAFFGRRARPKNPDTQMRTKLSRHQMSPAN